MKILILAAGRNSRFAGQPKALVNFWGMRVIDLLVKEIQSFDDALDFCVIVNDVTEPKVQYDKHIQGAGYGTGAAVRSYVRQNSQQEDLLVIPGDAPLFDANVLEKFQHANADIVVGVMKTPLEEERYGRIILQDGKIKKIAEYIDHPAKTEFVNTGIIYMGKQARFLLEKLQENSRQEVYLTDIVELAATAGMKIEYVELKHEQSLGFNTGQELMQLLTIAQQKWRKQAQTSGAVFQDISSVYLAADTKFEEGALIEPNVKFGPGVSVKKGAQIKSFSYLENCTVHGLIGPFAHVKSGTIDEGAHVGAFVELKNSHIKKKAKIKHLTYIGDAMIGESVNVGAGVIVCNYDGVKKNTTEIGDNAFIGANSVLVAPIAIGEEAFLAAGGVYAKDVQSHEFAIARAIQVNKKNKKKG